jgi:hypothetical protein
MSEVTFFLIRIAYLAILWIFVLSAISVIRSDMFGAKVTEGGSAPLGPAPSKKRAVKPRRGQPNYLVISEGLNQGVQLALAGQTSILIGRGPDAAIKLDDDYVSTRHARVVATGAEWMVEDLGSTNGTYVNNVRITEPTLTAIGVPIRIGKTVLELRK